MILKKMRLAMLGQCDGRRLKNHIPVLVVAPIFMVVMSDSALNAECITMSSILAQRPQANIKVKNVE
jgi:hypothetical protein